MIKLLLVEDDVNLCYIVQAGLQDVIGGYEVITAGNGLEGLHAWEEHKPDIIISDIDMPEMDGFEMVRRIRETDGDTPILFASAMTSPKDVKHGYELGVNNYVKKPDVFVTKLRKLFTDDPDVEIKTAKGVGLMLVAK